jgi:Protein of unknown function (DUF3455)
MPTLPAPMRRARLVLAAAALALITGCASAPPELQVDGPKVARVHATGFQVYTCQADAAGKLGWTLKAPDATFSGDGLAGRHYQGPTWENTADHSKVTGKKVTEHKVDGAVPWLLLEATGHEGSGALSQVTFIQRLETTGGLAPAAPGKAGDEARIPYTADYVFFGAGAKKTEPGR